jgi:hypothetical protein
MSHESSHLEKIRRHWRTRQTMSAWPVHENAFRIPSPATRYAPATRFRTHEDEIRALISNLIAAQLRDQPRCELGSARESACCSAWCGDAQWRIPGLTTGLNDEVALENIGCIKKIGCMQNRPRENMFESTCFSDEPGGQLDPILGRDVEHTDPIFRPRSIHWIRSSLARRLGRAPNWRDGVRRKWPVSV